VTRWNLAHLHKYPAIVAWYRAGHHCVSSNVCACWSQVVTECLVFPYPVSAPFWQNRSQNVEAVYEDTVHFRGHFDRPLDARGRVVSFDALFGHVFLLKSTFWSKVRRSLSFLRLVSKRLRHRRQRQVWTISQTVEETSWCTHRITSAFKMRIKVPT
jgi:hypothetical protein